MDRNNTYIIGGMIAVGVLVFLFIFFRSTTIQNNNTSPESPQSITENTEGGGVPIETIISAKHAYRKGEHQLAGEILLPTPCHLLEHTVTILPDESRATIAFSRNFNGTDCQGGEIPARFFIKFKGKSETVIRATLDGREVTLSLIEATADENLETTEVYTKG